MEKCKELNKCLCCDSENLRTILDLGSQSPANNYNVKEKFPLKLNVCLDCSHAQLSNSVDPDILFRDYPYMSGVSQTMRDYYAEFASKVSFSIPHNDTRTVFEIACNDGAQLDELKERSFKTFGIDPAKNLHEKTNERHQVICGYFPQDAPEATFDIVVAQNVFAHVDDPQSFLKGCKKIMHKDSLLFIQTSQAHMLDNYQADTIYHEHISFFNKRSITTLFTKCGFEVAQHTLVEHIHGGSDLYVLKRLPDISILDYSDFSNRCYKFANELKETVKEIQKTSHVICYGAAAKMINLIRFTGIEPDAIIDDTPTKQNKLIDGKYSIVPFRDLEVAKKGSYIIPVWNFFDEIKAKVEKEHPGKFKFLKYIPIIE